MGESDVKAKGLAAGIDPVLWAFAEELAAQHGSALDLRHADCSDLEPGLHIWALWRVPAGELGAVVGRGGSADEAVSKGVNAMVGWP